MYASELRTTISRSAFFGVLMYASLFRVQCTHRRPKKWNVPAHVHFRLLPILVIVYFFCHLDAFLSAAKRTRPSLPVEQRLVENFHRHQLLLAGLLVDSTAKLHLRPGKTKSSVYYYYYH